MPARLLRPLAVLVSAALMLVAVAPAQAQTGADVIGSPLTTKRLERLLRVYVAPTAEEASAIDRLHEAYLDRFRAEIDPDIKQAVGGMGRGTPSSQDFKKMLREIERIQSRIADADNLLFAGASEVVAEERRGGIQRIRDARERQRQLMGLPRLYPTMMGSMGGAFVDIADLLARDDTQLTIPAEARERFDAFLRAQESRVLVQARSYNLAVGKAVEKWFEGVVAAQEARLDTAEAGQGAQDERGSNLVQRMREIAAQSGVETRKIIAANFRANRAACAELAAILPGDAVADFRIRLAERSMGSLPALAGVTAATVSPDQSPARVAARIRRDPAVTDEKKQALSAIVSTWRAQAAQATDGLAEAALEIDPLDQSAWMADGDDAPQSEGLRRLTAASQRVVHARQVAYQAMFDLIGERGERYFFEIGTGEARLVHAIAEAPPEDGPDQPPTPDAPLETDASRFGLDKLHLALSAPPLVRILERLEYLGVKPESRDAVEAVLVGWMEASYRPTVRTALEAYSQLVRERWRLENEDRPTVDTSRDAEILQAARRALDACFAAEALLHADLAAAAGVAPDGPEITALRLDRLQLLDSEAGMSVLGESRRLAVPIDVLRGAQVDGETARRIFAESIDAWRALASEIPARCAAVLDSDAEKWKFEAAMTNADPSKPPEMGDAWIQHWDGSMRRAQADRDRVAKAIEDAALAAVADAAVRAGIARAQHAIAFPELHKPADCATRQLAAALLLDELNDDQRTRLEVLKAEYDAVYAELTDQLVASSSQPKSISQFREAQAAREAFEKIRFQRTERTSKALGEARRILGDELAQRVRGLAPRAGDAAPRAASRSVFGLQADDDD